MTAEYYVWLQLCLGFANDAVSRVLANYGTAKNFHSAPDSERIAKCRLNKRQIAKLHSVPRKDVFNILNECQKSGINIITPEDAMYPEGLQNIPDLPAVLYVKGNLPEMNSVPVISVVGPRRVSQYGEKCAYVISNTLADCGFIIVSGGAVGGDTAAHLGALDAGAKTVAVLGCGINCDYLKANEQLRERISNNGCLVSEYPPSMGVKRGAFQQRNRILSGLSDGVVVVEGGKTSGTLITARCAVEQGRDVFVIPGSPYLPQYEGSNRLLSEGAKPLLDINGIIEEYTFKYPAVIRNAEVKIPMPRPEREYNTASEVIPQVQDKQQSAQVNISIDMSMLSDCAKSIADFLQRSGFTEFTVDDIIDNTGLDVNSVLSAVTEMEIFGILKTLPGGRFNILKDV